MEKLIRRNIWIVVGVTVVSLIAMVAAWGNYLIKPQNAAIAKARQTYTTRKAVADQLPSALAEKVRSEDNREYVKGQLAFFQQRYRHLDFGNVRGTGDANVAALQVGWVRWMNEYFNDYGVALRQELMTAADTTGVTINTSVKVVAPPKTPEEALQLIPSNGLLKPTGGALNVTISGALANILQFFNRINQSSILMVVDRNIKLDGYSPEIQATFSVTPYLVASGPGVLINASAGAAAGGAAAAPGGYPGGGSSGYPGGGSSGYPGGGSSGYPGGSSSGYPGR